MLIIALWSLSIAEILVWVVTRHGADMIIHLPPLLEWFRLIELPLDVSKDRRGSAQTDAGILINEPGEGGKWQPCFIL